MIEQMPELPWLQQNIPVLFDFIEIHMAECYTKNPQFYKRKIIEIIKVE